MHWLEQQLSLTVLLLKPSKYWTCAYLWSAPYTPLVHKTLAAEIKPMFLQTKQTVLLGILCISTAQLLSLAPSTGGSSAISWCLVLLKLVPV